ncbi:hypothetical protein HRJ34_15605 [Rhizorhabdus wittichii]|uniref:Uncharacterized protein n=1 Tax=Rhizorhabdus wittichii TaxID=160791 RepID=A0A975CXW4_9SPHN|nr:hypothetical protein [Rhizorhabdus wittichii]QTH19790.1 hypothetical protein HRJ34_15605 [Rhizorhabdus wittichii]
MVALLQAGVLTDDQLIDAAEVVAELGGDAQEAGHLVNCAILRASLPASADMKADQARSRFRVIQGIDGGNGDP